MCKRINLPDVSDLQVMLREMLKISVDALLDDDLGYEKYDNRIPKSNYRNWYSKKTVCTDLREVELDIPRDREGEFEPQIVPKNTLDLSAQTISRMTEKIMPVIEECKIDH